MEKFNHCVFLFISFVHLFYGMTNGIFVRLFIHSDTVEDLIRISVEGPSLEDESVVSGFSQSQRSRRTNYRCWPSEGHVTAMEDSP